MTANASDAVWQKLDTDLREYGDKVELAKSQFEGLSDSITKFGRQLEEAQSREAKITEMLQSFMSKIDQVSEQNWGGSEFSAHGGGSSRQTNSRPGSPQSLQKSIGAAAQSSRMKLASLSNMRESPTASPGNTLRISAADNQQQRIHIHREW